MMLFNIFFAHWNFLFVYVIFRSQVIFLPRYKRRYFTWYFIDMLYGSQSLSMVSVCWGGGLGTESKYDDLSFQRVDFELSCLKNVTSSLIWYWSVLRRSFKLQRTVSPAKSGEWEKELVEMLLIERLTSVGERRDPWRTSARIDVRVCL